MGTFHQGKHALHGITVVVETAEGELVIGRCDDWTESDLHLRDADVYREGEHELGRAAYLARARSVGVWPRHRRLSLAAARVVSVAPLGEAGG